MQDWGEEVEEGAIYNVTLKRVQIQQAANKGARWLGVSGPVWCLPVWQNHKEETTRAPNLSETHYTYENHFPPLWTCWGGKCKVIFFYQKSRIVSASWICRVQMVYKSNPVSRMPTAGLQNRKPNLYCSKQTVSLSCGAPLGIVLHHGCCFNIWS